jgi:hypothetical protein
MRCQINKDLKLITLQSECSKLPSSLIRQE